MNAEAGTKQVRVMLVEDHPGFRDLMEVLLGSQSDIKLVAQAGSLAEARNHAVRSEFDVAVLVLGLPDGDGVDLIADLRQANPDVGVLILSASLIHRRACKVNCSSHLPPTWTAGRLVPSGSASRKTSWVTGAVSPSPNRRKRNRYTMGLPSVHPK